MLQTYIDCLFASDDEKIITEGLNGEQKPSGRHVFSGLLFQQTVRHTKEGIMSALGHT